MDDATRWWGSCVAATLSVIASGCYLHHEAPGPVADGGVLNDARLEPDAAPPDAALPVADVVAPRPIAPLSTSTVTSQRPTLRWELPIGVTGALVEICLDRSCENVLETRLATGDSVRPERELPVGVVYFRLTGLRGGFRGATPSATWQFNVGHRSAPRDTSWGSTLDFDGDGFADVAITEFGGRAINAPDTADRVHLHRGGPAGLAPTSAMLLESPDELHPGFGRSIASAGDVNGDGFPELIVGAPGFEDQSGRAYLYYGGPSGFSRERAVTLPGPPDARDLFGATVAGVGDVDGDGYGDVLIGAPWAEDTAGRAHLYHGGPDGLEPEPTTLQGEFTGLESTREDVFGSSVAGAGDVNADGFADVIVGAPGRGHGAASLYLGSPDGLQIPRATELYAVSYLGDFGDVVRGAGDLNGDGYADVVIAAGGSTYVTRARVVVFFGSADGVDEASRLELSAGDLDIGFGTVTRGAGDTNRDGYADLVVLTNRTSFEDPSLSSGGARIYFGSADGLDERPRYVWLPRESAQRAYAASGVGDVDGDAVADVLIGAAAASGGGAGHVFQGAEWDAPPATVRPRPGTDGSRYGSVLSGGD